MRQHIFHFTPLRRDEVKAPWAADRLVLPCGRTLAQARCLPALRNGGADRHRPHRRLLRRRAHLLPVPGWEVRGTSISAFPCGCVLFVFWVFLFWVGSVGVALLRVVRRVGSWVVPGFARCLALFCAVSLCSVSGLRVCLSGLRAGAGCLFRFSRFLFSRARTCSPGLPLRWKRRGIPILSKEFP